MDTRVDKNVITNILDFRKFAEDADLMKMLLFYFAYKKQNRLYDFGTLDIEEFSKLFRIQRENLVALHPNPKHIAELQTSRQLSTWNEKLKEDPKNLKYRFFDSYIENALYRLYTENLVFSGTTKQYISNDGSINTEYPLERIVFLSSLKARHIKTKRGQTKIVYDYTLNESFLKNLGLYFAQVNLNHINHLRKGNAEDLYLYLSELKNTLTAKNETYTDTVSFEFLCDLANIQVEENKDRKKKLIKKFALLNEKIGFPVKLSFITTPGHRWAYQPVITFTEMKSNANANHKTELIQQREEIFLNNFLHNLTELIKTHFPEHTQGEEGFQQCIIDFCRLDKMSEEKVNAYLKAQELSFIKPHPQAIKKAHLIPYKLLSIESIADINDVILGRK